MASDIDSYRLVVYSCSSSVVCVVLFLFYFSNRFCCCSKTLFNKSCWLELLNWLWAQYLCDEIFHRNQNCSNNIDVLILCHSIYSNEPNSSISIATRSSALFSVMNVNACKVERSEVNTLNEKKNALIQIRTTNHSGRERERNREKSTVRIFNDIAMDGNQFNHQNSIGKMDSMNASQLLYDMNNVLLLSVGNFLCSFHSFENVATELCIFTRFNQKIARDMLAIFNGN